MGGCLRFSEVWHHPSGLTITAYDREYVGRDGTVARDYIDAILNGREPKQSDYLRALKDDSPRETFEIVLISKGTKVLYRSNKNQGEQGVGGNPLPRRESEIAP
ncbi:hypothetical protein HNR46_004236 [Haloferula luteola]|uniref:Uncharacterized protein n=1 Tax=Haloferula luteola TaxID=595692 RepID=A0A840V7H0_9BACT|nr:hypothetical protein [Haloferula luteola]MBB5353965.1 hypothetical protein [Haloferula luteola]